LTKLLIFEAVPKLQFLEQLFTPGENCISHKYLTHKKLAIFSKSLFYRTEGSYQPGFRTSSISNRAHVGGAIKNPEHRTRYSGLPLTYRCSPQVLTRKTMPAGELRVYRAPSLERPFG
jgi:hypothetical protein